jgi:hypothetical protein
MAAYPPERSGLQETLAALRRTGFIARNLYVLQWREFAGGDRGLSSDKLTAVEQRRAYLGYICS